MNLKEKICFLFTQLSKGVQKIIKTLLAEDFVHLPPVPTTLVVHLEMRISPLIVEKIEMVLIVYSEPGGS